MNRLDAVKKFLMDRANPDLASLMTPEMELQVNVGQDGGEKVTGDYDGHKWWGYSKDGETWKPFRVPWRANTDNPDYIDYPLKFSTDHFEAIGLTGWNWQARLSQWVGFDFDSIVGHKAGLSDDELQKVRKSVEDVPWVTVRKSTSGKGLHLYVFLEPAIPTGNHTEHAALARSILGLLSARIGAQLHSKVDTCGGILWIWHRKQSSDGYTLVRRGVPLSDVPVNWRDHAEAASGRGNKRVKTCVPGTEAEALEELVSRTKVAQLDDTHKLLFGWLAEHNRYWYWDADRGLLVAHTFDLQEAHRALKFKGPYYTVSTGKDAGAGGKDQNCFAFPLRNGAWVVRRHTRRTAEHAAWTVDSGGWTRCYFNCPANFITSARCHGGVERPDGRFEFSTVEQAVAALKDLGAVPFEIEPFLLKRPALLREHRDGRAVLSALYLAQDPTQPAGWSFSKDKAFYERLVDIQNEQPEVEVPDDFVRHLVAGGQDAGWFIYTRTNWTEEPEGNIRKALTASGVSIKVHQQMLGQCVLHPWYLVCKPFQPEYPGNRSWNRRAPQFAYDPVEGNWPTWRLIFEHCGKGLDEAVARHQWCIDNEIKTGSDYLLMWVAAMFQHPNEPLPYLFLYNPIQNTGKSSFHEAISLLMKDRVGYVKADISLTSTSRFNAELANAVLCVVEEVDLRVHRDAYARVKDWVTSKTLLIHEKGRTPYEVPNNTHWIQTANPIDACPSFSGDTRIVICKVELPAEEIPKVELLAKLDVEGPAFTYELMHIEVPKSNSRLRIPVITSADKLEAEMINETSVQMFFQERVFPCNGNALSLQELYDAFLAYIPITSRSAWKPDKFRRAVPGHLVRGKWGAGGFYHIANVSLDARTPPGPPLQRMYDKLVEPGDLFIH